MKPVWLWVIFFFAYALFSMKTHAAEVVLTAPLVLPGSECPLGLSRQG